MDFWPFTTKQRAWHGSYGYFVWVDGAMSWVSGQTGKVWDTPLARVNMLFAKRVVFPSFETLLVTSVRRKRARYQRNGFGGC